MKKWHEALLSTKDKSSSKECGAVYMVRLDMNSLIGISPGEINDWVEQVLFTSRERLEGTTTKILWLL